MASANCSVIDLIRYLAMQALQLDPVAAGKHICDNFDASRVRSASTEESWLEVLSTVLSSFPWVYLIVDCEILGSSGRSSEGLLFLIRLLHKLTLRQSKTTIKIALATYRKRPFVEALNRLHDLPQTRCIQLEKLLKSGSTSGSFASSTGRRGKAQGVFRDQVALHGTSSA